MTKPSKPSMLTGRIDKNELNAILTEWYEQKQIDPSTKIPDIVGEAIINIAEKIIRAPCFRRYSEDWRSDMIDSGITSMVGGVKNFNPHLKKEGKAVNGLSLLMAYCYRGFVNSLTAHKDEANFFNETIVLNEIDSLPEELIPYTLNNYDDDEMTRSHLQSQMNKTTTNFYHDNY